MLELIFSIVLAVISTFLIGILVAAYLVYRKVFYQNPKKKIIDPYRVVKEGAPDAEYKRALIDSITSLEYENIYTVSHDGLKLRARLYMTSPDAPFAIQCHGYRSTPMTDFSGGGALALKLGFNVIMIDQRAHGESDGRTITFGYKESDDIVAWANYIGEHFGKDRKIILFGVSMGGSSVILAAAKENLPKSVVGAFADCPFSSAKKIISEVIARMGMPPKLLYYFARLGARLYGDFDPDRATPEAAIKSIKIPLILVHGDADTYVPHKMSADMHATSDGKIPLHTFNGANHGSSYIVDTERYEKITEDFCKQCLEVTP